MHLSRLAALALTSLTAGAACIASLDDEFTGGGPGPVSPVTGDDAAVAAGCAPFATTDGASAVSGDLHSTALPEGGALWIADQVQTSDGGVTLGAAITVGAGAASDCSGPASLGGPAFDPSPVDPAGLRVALDLVRVPRGLYAYYSLFASDPTKAFGLRLLGFGVARQSTATGRFTPTAPLLWSADRPAYGASALVWNGALYVYGCKSNQPLTNDCYVATANPDAIDDAAAYVYWTGSAWSPSADDAAPVTPAGGSVSVRADPSGSRVLMTYVPTFGTSLVARSAIAPEGPWSAPVELARCALDSTIPGVFCGGGEQHPELASGTNRLVVSYDDRTLVPDAGPHPRGSWPHLVELPVPPSLP